MAASGLKRRVGVFIAGLALWLLAGMLINVLATWALCAVPAPSGVIEKNESFYWPFPIPPEWAMKAKQQRFLRTRWCDDVLIVAWVTRPPRYTGNSISPATTLGVTYGVPFRSLGGVVHDFHGTPSDERLLRIGVGSRQVALPLFPLWPGFALNTLFYAALAWGLWRAPLAIRRIHRRRGGRCARCGYDLKGLTVGAMCPECGAA